MGKSSPAVDRAVRIELLRARAALEREALVANVSHAAGQLTPAAALRGLMPGLMGATRSSGAASGLAMQAWRLWRQYPMLGSTLSALALGGSRKSRLVKAIVGSVVAWKAFQMWRDSQSDDASSN